MEKYFKEGRDIPLFKTVAAASIAAILLSSCEYAPAPTFTPSLNPTVVDRMHLVQEVVDIPPTASFKRSWCMKSKPCKKMAEALVYEARGEGLGSEGMAAVGIVIKNRADGDNRFPDTIIGVIEQRHQFSYLADMHKQRKPTDSDWIKAYAVSYDVLNGEYKSLVGSATHYHANYVQPSWSNHLEKVATIGNHIFYWEK